MNENSKAAQEDRLPDEELVGQINTFLCKQTYHLTRCSFRSDESFSVAGTDTTSNALSRILYLLGLYPDAQTKLRQELIDAGAPDNLDYDLLDRLPYLEAVCRETLRLYAPVRFLQRVYVIGLVSFILSPDPTDLMVQVPGKTMSSRCKKLY